MKKVSRLMFSALAFLTIGSTVAVSAGAVSADSVTDTKATMSNLSTENSALLSKLNAAQDKVSAIDNQVSDKTIAIDKAEKDIVTTDKQITAIDQKITKVQAEVKARKTVLKEQVVALQKQAGESVSGNVYIDFIVNSNSISDMISRTSVVGKLNQANKEAMTAVANSESKLANLKATQTAKKATLQDTKQQLVNDQAKLTTLKTNAEKEQANFEKEVNGHKTQLAALQAQLDAQTANAVKAAKESAKNNAPKAPTTKTPMTPAAPTPVAENHTTSSVNTGSLIGNAMQFIGTPYVWGGTTPAGFDCSGLVWYSAKLAGINLPRTSQQQSTLGSMVAISDLQPGDLVFWGGVGSAHHVGIYIGGGTYIHAPRPGKNVQTMSIQYYRPDFGRRL